MLGGGVLGREHGSQSPLPFRGARGYTEQKSIFKANAAGNGTLSPRERHYKHMAQLLLIYFISFREMRILLYPALFPKFAPGSSSPT